MDDPQGEQAGSGQGVWGIGVQARAQVRVGIAPSAVLGSLGRGQVRDLSGRAEVGYAALCWTAGRTGQLGIDPARLAVAGRSAGGTLAAAVALAARDRSGPALAFQLLLIPALDDRGRYPSIA